MAKLVLDFYDEQIWNNNVNDIQKILTNSLELISQCFGDHGIDLQNEFGEDLSIKGKYEFHHKHHPEYIFSVGERVETASEIQNSLDRTFLKSRNRKPDMTGVVVERYDYPKTYYRVAQDDDTIAYYQSEELFLTDFLEEV